MQALKRIRLSGAALTGLLTLSGFSYQLDGGGHLIPLAERSTPVKAGSYCLQYSSYGNAYEECQDTNLVADNNRYTGPSIFGPEITVTVVFSNKPIASGRYKGLYPAETCQNHPADAYNPASTSCSFGVADLSKLSQGVFEIVGPYCWTVEDAMEANCPYKSYAEVRNWITNWGTAQGGGLEVATDQPDAYRARYTLKR